MSMRYGKAIRILQEYLDWKNDDIKQRMPKSQDITEAVQFAIGVMQALNNGVRPVPTADRLKLNKIQEILDGK